MPVAAGQAPLELVLVLGDTVDTAYGSFFVIASTGRLSPPSVAGEKTKSPAFSCIFLGLKLTTQCSNGVLLNLQLLDQGLKTLSLSVQVSHRCLVIGLCTSLFFSSLKIVFVRSSREREKALVDRFFQSCSCPIINSAFLFGDLTTCLRVSSWWDRLLCPLLSATSWSRMATRPASPISAL